MQRTNFFLTDKQIDALREMAKRTGLSVAELVRRAIDAMLAKESKRERPRP